MKKVVYFTDPKSIHSALSFFDMKGYRGREIPVKLHMGEIRNKWFVKPDFIRLVVDELKSVGAKPYLTDTTVAYNSMRSTQKGYEKVARIHGFTEQSIGCPVVIDDAGVPVSIEGYMFNIAKHIHGSDYMIVVSHVKGHIQTGMGGAIKNIGMGCVTKESKRIMHKDSKPVYDKDRCVYCGLCEKACPFKAIKVKRDEWLYYERRCFGCGVCVDICPYKALNYRVADLQLMLVYAAKACVHGKRVVYINELKRIAKGCDCDPWVKDIICPDIGYLVSDDVISIDTASLDLIERVKPGLFYKTHGVDPWKQVEHGERIGLGESSYELIEI
ncbi:MAG: DUF362 domain-containing protein [Candidatus Thermoplasmatota archaeon]